VGTSDKDRKYPIIRMLGKKKKKKKQTTKMIKKDLATRFAQKNLAQRGHKTDLADPVTQWCEKAEGLGGEPFGNVAGPIRGLTSVPLAK